MVIWAFGVSTFWYILILLEILEIGFFSLMALLYPLCQLFGHFRPDIIFCLGPVCVRLCLRLKIPFLQPTRTRGLAVPVDVSLYGVTSSPNVTSCIVSPFGIFPSLQAFTIGQVPCPLRSIISNDTFCAQMAATSSTGHLFDFYCLV